MFLVTGSYNRGHVKLMDAIQVVPGKKATTPPECFSLPFQYFNENRATKQGRLPNRICSRLHTDTVSVSNPENEPTHVRRRVSEDEEHAQEQGYNITGLCVGRSRRLKTKARSKPKF